MARRAQFQLSPKNGDMSGDITSNVIDLRSNYGCCIQANYTTTGTLGGVLSVEGSVDYYEDLNGNVLNSGTWNTLSGQTATLNVSNASGSQPFDITTTAFGWLRVTYATAESDTGTLNLYVQVKGYYQ